MGYDASRIKTLIDEYESLRSDFKSLQQRVEKMEGALFHGSDAKATLHFIKFLLWASTSRRGRAKEEEERKKTMLEEYRRYFYGSREPRG